MLHEDGSAKTRRAAEAPPSHEESELGQHCEQADAHKDWLNDCFLDRETEMGFYEQIKYYSLMMAAATARNKLVERALFNDCWIIVGFN